MIKRTKTRKLSSNQTNRSTSRKIGTKIYERAEGGERVPTGTTTPWLINNVHFCYGVDSPPNNDNKKKTTLPTA